MKVSRLRTLVMVLLGLATTSMPATAGDADVIEVFKLPDCTCCKNWVKYLESNGFTVKVTDVPHVPARTTIEQRLGVPASLSACHIATVGPYVLGGHVSAEEIRGLLSEAPKWRGLFVTGMPKGAPGMEGGDPERYEVIALDADGQQKVIATHGPSASPVPSQ